jgi:hypothetical protein
MHLLVVGVEAGTGHVADEARRIEVVDSRRPVLFRGHVGRHVQPIGVLAAQWLTV